MLLAGLLLCFLQAPADAAEKAIWGPVDLTSGRSAFPTYDRLGVDTWQYTLSWSSIAPTRPAAARNPRDPAYRWPAELDRAMAEAKRRRIKVALLVTNSPAWANGGRAPIWAPDSTAYADFLRAASARYPAVRRWMIWGEPNRSDRFRPNARNARVGPRAYAQLLDRAYGALKSRSRRNVVIGGMTWTGGDVRPARFVKYLRLPNGRPPRLDWFGHNPFPFRFPKLAEIPVANGYRDISDVDSFGKEVRKAYRRPCNRRERRSGKRTCGRSPRLWLSEFSVQSDHPSSTFQLFVSRRQQARWLSAGYGIADDVSGVAGLGWLSLFDERGRRGSAWGLLTADGARKPAYRAFARAPSERLRPRVDAPTRITRRDLRGRGLLVRLRPRTSGRLTLRLVAKSGRVLARGRGRSRPERPLQIRLRWRDAHAGRVRLVVAAPRAAGLRRSLVVR